MNSGDQAVTLIYLFGCIVLVVSSLMVRRLPLGQTLKMILAWLLIFAALFAVFALRDDFLALGRRIVGGATTPEVAGQEVRIRRSEDGHFWVDAEVNGQSLRFLVDSGATVTMVSAGDAARAGLEPGGGPGVVVETANGMTTVQRSRARSLRVGSIAREDFSVHISSGDFANVLGMNFLSSLRGWGVDGNVLVLRP